MRLNPNVRNRELGPFGQVHIPTVGMESTGGSVCTLSRVGEKCNPRRDHLRLAQSQDQEKLSHLVRGGRVIMLRTRILVHCIKVQFVQGERTGGLHEFDDVRLNLTIRQFSRSTTEPQ